MKLIEELTRKDRLKHLFILGPLGGFVGAILAPAAGVDPAVGILSWAATVGVLKEAIDSIGPFSLKKTGWDNYDLISTIFGGGLYYLIVHPMLKDLTNCLSTANYLLDCFF